MPLLQIPVFRAALIQACVLALVLTFAAGFAYVAQVQIPSAALALLQGVLAALITRRARMAPWWQVIQLALPPALLATLALHLPPVFFLVGFLLLLGLYWNTFRTQVPFYPSGPAARDAVAALLPRGRPLRFIDIGSGFGGLVLDLARRHPESTFTGIELAPVPWLASLLRNRLAVHPAHFVRGDYQHLDFGAYDVIFAYLSPAAMPGLWEKARAEMRPGALLLSYEFAIPGTEPHVSRAVADGGAALYGWYA